ncbi:hypothetical protein IJG76_00500 [Candidatus Saccharibacteria bacterium]|nr:hypothetical protein [Candidatus Saccharibacteria bacterium]
MSETVGIIFQLGNWMVAERPRSCHPGVKRWVEYYGTDGIVQIASYDEDHCERGGRDRTGGHYLWRAIPAEVDLVARAPWYKDD